MLIFTVSIGHPTVSGTHLDAYKHVYKPYTDTAVNFDFHRLAYISMMTTSMTLNEIIKVQRYPFFFIYNYND